MFVSGMTVILSTGLARFWRQTEAKDLRFGLRLMLETLGHNASFEGAR
jgi:hypothetical protein